MIDKSKEQLIPLSVAARETPNRTGGSGINISTIWRWSQSGCRSVRLETVMVGGIRMTSREAMQRFFEAVTAHSKIPADTAPSNERSRSINDAKHMLDDAGI